ncbi:MAG: Holliday junction resolvase RuvX [Acidobacteriota bacterium]
MNASKNNTGVSRVLGIDYGSVRVGLAVSDPLRIFAQGLGTLDNNERLYEKLLGVIDEKEITLIVVGLPLTLKGERGFKSDEVDRFIAELGKRTDVEIVQWDERFTSKIAQQTILSMGTKKMKRREKGKVDEIAAAVMLQGFLDQTKPSIIC